MSTPVRRGPFAWTGAFTGFYPAQSSDFADLDPVIRFLYASVERLVRLPARARHRGPALVLAAVGALALWAYDAAPRALKELGLGAIVPSFSL